MVKKIYTDELSLWVDKKRNDRKRKDKSLVSFLAVRLDIKSAIDAGYSKKTIWEHLTETGKISYGYQTFLQHVKKHIKNEIANKETETREKIKDDNSTPKKQLPKKRPPSEGFNFNSAPNEEDLI